MEEKKKRPLRRTLTFLTTAALVLGAVFLVANWESLNFDAVKRWFAYRSLEKNESGQVESFRYIGGSDSAFAQLGDDLLVCSPSGIRLYSPSGAAYFEETLHLDRPVIRTGGNRALVYDAGGRELFVYGEREQIFSYTAQGADTILSASLNPQGRLTVITHGGGLKASVTTYDDEFRPLLGVNLSSRFVTDAHLSPDGQTLALATAGQEEGIYNSEIALYSLSRSGDRSEPDAVCSLGNSTVLAVDWSQTDLRVVCENTLFAVAADGTLKGSYSYDGRYLKGFSTDGEGFTTLLLGKYRAGTSSQLITLDEDCAELAVLPVEAQILSLSSSGRYCALLTADALTIYTRQLETYHTLEGTQGARKALQRADGSALLIAGETARLYLPN